MNKRRAFLILGILFSSSLYAANIDEIINLALEGNPEIKQNADTIDDYLYDKPEFLKLKNSSISAGGGYKIDLDDPNASKSNWSLGLSVPIIPQLSLSGQYSGTSNDISLGLSFKPFEDSPDMDEWADGLSEIETGLREKYQTIAASAENYYISYIAAKEKLSISEERQKSASENREQAKFLYDQGIIDFASYQDSVKTLTTANQTVLNSRKDLYNLQKTGLTLFGNASFLEDADNWTLSYEELLIRIENLKSKFNDNPTPVFANTAKLQSELSSLTKKEKDTWIWEPNLSLSASSGIPFENLDISGSVSFSYDQIKARDKQKLKKDIEEKLREIDREIIGQEFQLTTAKMSAETSEQNLSLQELSLELAQSEYDEAEIGYKLGTVGEKELANSILALKEAKLNIFKTAAELLKSLRDLTLYYPELQTFGMGE